MSNFDFGPLVDAKNSGPTYVGGKTRSRPVPVKDDTLIDPKGADSPVESLPGSASSKVSDNRVRKETIGVKSARLIVQPKSTFTTTTFDTTSRPGYAEILLTNSSGSSQQIVGVAIAGQTITRFSGDDGYTHDDFIDYEDIYNTGVRTFEVSNDMIMRKQQVEAIADYWAKWHGILDSERKHIYGVSLYGTRFDITPGDRYELSIVVDNKGIYEDIDSTVECYSVDIERRPGGPGTTHCVFREVEENWAKTSFYSTVFKIIGNASRKISRANSVFVGASDFTEETSYVCDGTADDVQIQAAINAMAERGGGTVLLSPGTFYTTSTIVLTSNITVMGSNEGQTTIEKNANGEAFEAIGTSGNELRNVFILKMSITKNSSDSNLQPFVRFDYTDNSRLRDIDISSSVEEGFVANYCDGLTVENCSANGCGLPGFAFLDSTSIKVSGCRTSATGDAGILAESCSDLSIENCTVSDSTGAGINVTFSPATSVTGCRVLDVSDTTSSLFRGIYVAGLGCTISACTVSNVTVSGGCDGIILSSGGGSITGCTVENVQASGDDIQGIFIFGGITSISGCTVQNITQTGSERCYGIYADETTITGCVIDTVENTNISSTKIVRGAYLRNRSTISNSTIRSVTTSGSGSAAGIDLDTGVYAARAANGCTVESCDDYGIYVQCDDSVVSANYAESNGYGIYIETTADRTVVTGNRLTNNVNPNIQDNGTNTTTTGNDFT